MYCTINIFKIVKNGDIDKVKEYVENGFEIDKSNKDGSTSLLLAIQGGHSEIVKYLISKGANLKKRANDGSYPFELACLIGNLDYIKLFIDNGYKISEEDFMSLNYAVANTHYKVVQFLIDSGMDVNYGYSIHWATQEGCLEIVKLLYESGARLEKEDAEGMTPLYIAASEGHKNIADYLITNKVNINYFNDKVECTPLNIACIFNNIEIVELLLQNKADVEVPDHEGRTPLLNAVFKGYIEVVRLLLEYGVNTRVRDKNNKGVSDYNILKNKKQILDLITRGRI